MASRRIEELKAMVVARSGNVTSRDDKGLNKAELQKVVQAYLLLEADKPSGTAYFNRAPEENSIFAKVNNSER